MTIISLNEKCENCSNYGFNAHQIKTCKIGIIRVSSLVFPNCKQYKK